MWRPTFVAKAEQVDEGAVRRAERGVILLWREWLELGQVRGAGGREDRRVNSPVGGGRGGGLVVGSHVTADPVESKST